jgi:hypothetical protein
MISMVTANVYAWLFHMSSRHGWSSTGKARGRLRITPKPVEQVSSISIIGRTKMLL